MRTNIEIEDILIAEGLALTGLKTKKELINTALREHINYLKRIALYNLGGKIEWEGNLEEMRSNGYD